MPELPEVETVRRGLEPAMVGARLTKVEQRRPDLRFPFPARFAERLEGRTVTAIGRRAKYLLADLSSGEVLVMHLGMSGRFVVTRDGATEMPGEFHHRHGEREGPRPCGVSPLERRPGHLQRRAPLRLHGPRPPRRDRDLPAFRRHGHRAPRQRTLGRDHRDALPEQAHGPQGRPPRPAAHRRPRQYLCLRGALPRRPPSRRPRRAPSPPERAGRRMPPTASPRSSATC